MKQTSGITRIYYLASVIIHDNYFFKKKTKKTKQGFQGMPGHPGLTGYRGPLGPVGPTVR